VAEYINGTLPTSKVPANPTGATKIIKKNLKLRTPEQIEEMRTFHIK
jgi:hypothetical protein